MTHPDPEARAREILREETAPVDLIMVPQLSAKLRAMLRIRAEGWRAGMMEASRLAEVYRDSPAWKDVWQVQTSQGALANDLRHRVEDALKRPQPAAAPSEEQDEALRQHVLKMARTPIVQPVDGWAESHWEQDQPEADSAAQSVASHGSQRGAETALGGGCLGIPPPAVSERQRRLEEFADAEALERASRIMHVRLGMVEVAAVMNLYAGELRNRAESDRRAQPGNQGEPIPDAQETDHE